MRLVSPASTSCAALLFLCVLTGCDHTRDITESDRVRAGGFVGRCFELQRDAEIRRGDRPPYDWLYPRPRVPSTDTSNEVIGVVDHGVRFRIEKVVLFKFGLLPMPAFAPKEVDITLARILDGPHTGKLVSTGDLSLSAYSPGVNETFFRPCNGDD